MNFGNLIKSFVFALIAMALIVGNYFIENQWAVKDAVTADAFQTFNYAIENIIPHRGIIRFAPEDESGIVNSMIVDNANPSAHQYIFSLASARLWGNFTISDAEVNILAGSQVVIMPDHAAFDLEFDGERIVLSVFDGDVYIGFLDEGIVVEEYVDQYSQIFMNKLLVPRGTQVNIPLKKLSSKLESLLYLKLVKEFKYSVVPSSLRESEWVFQNMNEDSKYLESIKQMTIADIIYKGSSAQDSLMNDFVFWSEENLTFVPDKKREIIMNHLFAYLDDAIFYANEGDEILAEVNWNDFNDYLASLSNEFKVSEDYLQRYDSYTDKLAVFSREDSQYMILKKILDKKFFEESDVYEIVNMFWMDVYEALDSSSVAAEQALNEYYSYFDSLIRVNGNEDFYKDYISYQNQLFDNLLLRESVFYRDGYFAMKNVIEEELLGLYEGTDLYDELSQELISNKIDFLKRLKLYFFDDEIEVSEAKEILSRLVEEINEFMPEGDSSVAVIELFESRLEDIGDFWGYLNSPEYHISKTYGVTHEERYESYLEEKDRIWDFINIQEEVTGEIIAEVSIADVEAEILAVFTANSEVGEIEIIDLTDVEQRYVNVQGVIGGYPFEARYDRDKDSLIDVYTYGELVSDRAVKLGSLHSLLQETFADLADADFGEEEYTIEHYAERAARLYIAELLVKYGFVAEMDDVMVVDELNAIYRVEEVSLEAHENIILTFDFLMNEEAATNLFLTVDGKPLVLDNKYSLDELVSIAAAEEDFSVKKEEEDEGVLR